jgi:hypothetical protein
MITQVHNFYAFAFGKHSGQDYAESQNHQASFLASRVFDRADADIMLARTMAKERGATPAEVQANVMALDSDEYPIRVRRWSDFA